MGNVAPVPSSGSPGLPRTVGESRPRLAGLANPKTAYPARLGLISNSFLRLAPAAEYGTSTVSILAHEYRFLTVVRNPATAPSQDKDPRPLPRHADHHTAHLLPLGLISNSRFLIARLTEFGTTTGSILAHA